CPWRVEGLTAARVAAMGAKTWRGGGGDKFFQTICGDGRPADCVPFIKPWPSCPLQWPGSRVPYISSKAALIRLSKSLGKELADTSVRVNCVTPAAVRTPLFAQMTQAHIDYMLSKIPLGRLGEPQEIAALVAWLASQECSFSTGAVFDLSGGRSTY